MIVLAAARAHKWWDKDNPKIDENRQTKELSKHRTPSRHQITQANVLLTYLNDNPKNMG